MSFAGLFIDLLVAGLLAITIGYCALLNRRLKKMRADEDMMRAVITELVKSTETAERAILGLRATASECNKTISARITEARDIVGHLDKSVAIGRHQTSQPRMPQPQVHQAAHAPAPLTPQNLQAQVARQVQMSHQELSRRMAAEAQASAQQAFIPPAPVNDASLQSNGMASAGIVPPVQSPSNHADPALNAVPASEPNSPPTASQAGLYDDLEASLAEIARRNRSGVAA
ncbi:MAG: DUF6468 domain-containing protein [Pseudomonadota bacterium]